LPGARRCRAFSFPDGEAWEAAVLGAITLLCDDENWEEYGSVSPLDAAQAFLVALDSWGGCMEPGFIVASARADVPAGWLLCDGAEYQVADFPRLYEAIGNTWGGTPGSTFAVPSFADRALVGAGVQSLGAIFGEAEHVLSVGEMPAHQHGEITAVDTPTFVGEIPAVLAVAGAGSTGSAGSGAAHNNIPPSAAVKWLIRV
jgi:microcystin-dependent protein